MINHIDHIVLTVSDIEQSVQFYKRVLQMEEVSFANGRKAVKFGNQKINFQRLGQEPRNLAQVGSGDLCLISSWSLDEVVRHLANENVEIIEGPAQKSGAVGTIESVYFLDPDSNLIEVSVYD
ncbi:VOC family virulence protein [Vibrio parahaemolyticus]|uniref:VOC family protein n=1 Tax=Vibrio parahaemolyticus TaxID=670 RepID=UPI001123B670|nr:VOC family virulence protein [Vibrio parahaemolyticus]TOM68551.1 VOC family virulence protein [Vibrio parahaemolyticus]TOM69391.1 VOC family virulence protein [Vibrio parahaemolyticus]TOO79860.1 VOC family virulence protein [Vibrio parahaemolyticus]